MLVHILYVEVFGSKVEDVALVVLLHVVRVAERPVQGLMRPKETVEQRRLVARTQGLLRKPCFIILSHWNINFAE